MTLAVDIIDGRGFSMYFNDVTSKSHEQRLISKENTKILTVTL